MKIVVAEHFGICFGLRDAITQAEALAAEDPLTIFGELAHNPIATEDFPGCSIVTDSPSATERSRYSLE